MASPLNGFNLQKSTLITPFSGINSIDSLVSEIQWAPNLSGITALTYSFPWASSSTAMWAPDYSSINAPSSAFALTPVQQQAVRDVLATWSNVANVTFTEIDETSSNVGDLRFAWTNVIYPGSASAGGWAGYPNNFFANGGDVWLSASILDKTDASWRPGKFEFSLLLHEVGHALGLKHPFAGVPILPTATDTEQYSVMSYTSHPKNLYLDVVPNGSGWYSFQYENINPQTPMLHDIAAIQYLYGANTGHRTGNDTYTFDPTKPFFQTLWDASGTDTISVFNFLTDCTINLTAGSFSKIAIPSDALPTGSIGGTVPTYDGTNNLAIAFGCLIENATGGQGNDTLIGNATNNTLLAGAGNDLLIGGGGNDTIDGGTGSDTARLEGAFASYTISFNSSLRAHIVNGFASGIDTYTSVEFFQFADVLRSASDLVVVDQTAPTVVSFSPVDEATSVAAGSNITLTFSEAIARGTGSIVLKTAAGTTVETYNTPTSTNLSLSGSVLTLNPSADLTAGTAYRIELAAGSIQDLAGNLFAGTASYNFTTAPNTATPSTVVTRVFLGSGNTFTAADSALAITGAAGTNIDTVRISNATTNTRLDANFERVELAGAVADFRFLTIAGVGTQVSSASTGAVVVTIPSLNQDMKMAFTNGSASLVQTGGSAFSLGGQAISTTSPSSFASTALTGFNAADVSTIGASSASADTSVNAPTTRVFLGSGNTFTAADNGLVIAGAAGTNIDTVRIGSATTNTRLDANFERVELAGAVADFRFITTAGVGTQVVSVSTGAVVVTIPSLNQDMKLVFTNGSASLVQTGGSAFSLGGQAISTTSPSSFTSTALAGFNAADVSTVGSSAPGGAIAVSGAGASSAAGGNFTYSIASGTYTHSIGSFAAGDKLVFFNGAAVAIVPDGNDTDGIQALTATNPATNAVTTITLTGLTSAQDASVFNVPSFNTVFGGGSLV